MTDEELDNLDEECPPAEATENPVQTGSRYKRGRRWREQSKWERSL